MCVCACVKSVKRKIILPINEWQILEWINLMKKTSVSLGVFELQLFLQNKAIGSILKEED